MPFLRFQKSGILEGCPSDVYLSMDHVTKLVYEVGTGLVVFVDGQTSPYVFACSRKVGEQLPPTILLWYHSSERALYYSQWSCKADKLILNLDDLIRELEEQEKERT